MTHALLRDLAEIKRHGYQVEKYGKHGFMLTDPEGASLMIGDYGHMAPTQWGAVAEALTRIEQNR